MAAIDPATFVVPQLVHYPTFDGREIPAWYFRPRAEAGTLAGGGHRAWRAGKPVPALTSTRWPSILAHHGYAVLAPNVRGSTGYGKAYSHLDDVEKRMDSVADLAHAAHWLRQQPEVDAAGLLSTEAATAASWCWRR
jgi:dipeptidyl aminopeptidase/acylaminoacyl peptidase